MNKTEEKIQQLELKIVEQKVNREKELLITEMKKIGIEKLPYSYSALKQFIDPETMDFHYNKHYKGYVDKLNSALSKKKYGDLELEQIIKTISRFDKTIRNNAGGAFNHALFWNMLSPDPKKLKGDLYKKIIKEFGSFLSFKKKFEEIAKERFGSGWVWLVLTGKNGLKIMSTPNQDNPLMNIVEGGGFPLLGLDLWEHAYYLKYKNKRDEYIANFWKVVNWDFVSKLYEMKTETKLLESTQLKKIMTESKKTQYCDSDEREPFKQLINNRQIKNLYSNEVTKILREKFNEFWVEGDENTLSGFYGVESPAARSMLNNLNTNFSTFCLLTRAVNRQIENIGKPDKKFNFSDEKKRNIEEVGRFLKALDFFKNQIFDRDNPDFINIINVLTNIWKKGQDTEDKVKSKLETYFGDRVKVKKIGAHGEGRDAFGGIDLIVFLDNKKNTSQVKPYDLMEKEGNKMIIHETGNVQPYQTDWMIFMNRKTNKVLVFKNNPLESQDRYVFDESSLIYEIN